MTLLGTVTNGDVFDFNERLAYGKKWERFLDAYFAGHWTIRAANMEQERRGIDRIFTNPNGKRLTVQYKTDSKAAKFGNFFIEIVSKDSPPSASGWAYTCEADRIFLFVPEWGQLCVCLPSWIRQQIPNWVQRYGVKPSRNKAYFTIGIPVPRDVIEDGASKIFKVRVDEAA